MEESNIHLLVSPYTKQNVKCSILIPALMLNNLFEINVKENIINTFEGKCIDQYGFINKIYKIIDIEGGKIEAENQGCTPRFKITFYALVCYPIIKRCIVCKIQNITEGLTIGKNGPIDCIITSDEIDNNNFFVDNEFNLRIKKTSALLKEGDFVKVMVNSINFKNNDSTINDYNVILVITTLIDMATEDEINSTYLHNNFIE
jgi:DNA-directed RNA polymerase subunit E'/Rpb7